MLCMMMVKAGKNLEAGVPPSEGLMAEIGRYTSEMTKAGVAIETGGLYPSSKGARVQVSEGKLSVVDGPFTEAKELIGGYAIIEAKSKQAAIQLGKRFMKIHVDVLGTSYTGQCEIRQMFDPSDFDSESR